MLRPGGHGLGDAFDRRTLSKDSVFMIKKINIKKVFPDKTVGREIPSMLFKGPSDRSSRMTLSGLMAGEWKILQHPVCMSIQTWPG